eukprot:scaffold3396_cov95-Skeletonema_dohrnii-CCMP3373.AAC.5
MMRRRMFCVIILEVLLLISSIPKSGAFGLGNAPPGLCHADIVQLLKRNPYSQGNNDSNGRDINPLKGSTAVVTGAAGGIGGEIAKIIHRLGGTVVALDRDVAGLEKLKDTLDDEERSRGDLISNESRVWVLPTQHQDLDSVSHSANQIIDRFDRIDFLVNNAGLTYRDDFICGDERMKATNGQDLLFTVNYLSHFLLTEKLLPNLSRAKGRVVHLTSTYHWKVDGSEIIPGNAKRPQAYEFDPSSQSPKHIERSYGNSKLAQIYHSRSIHMHAPDCDSVCACPTWAATGIGGEDARDFLSMMAFPIQGSNEGETATTKIEEIRYGPGITSAINAMFRPREELGDALNCGRSFVANSRTLEFFVFRNSLLRWPIWRDGLTDLLGLLLLLGQRITYEDFIIQETSPESQDEEKRSQLYNWSRKEVQEWL